MCEQCLTNAQALVQDVLPGYTLMQAQAGSTDWPQGWYGLVRSNDPEVVFPGPLLRDPWEGLSDEEIGRIMERDQAYQAQDVFCAAVAPLNARLTLHVMAGYELVTACMQAGYTPAGHGTELAFWLLNHLATAAGVEKPTF